MGDNFTTIDNALELREFLNGKSDKELYNTRLVIGDHKLIDPAGSAMIRGLRIAEVSVEGGEYTTEYVF